SKCAPSKALAGAFFASVASKEVICTMLGQFRVVFVSVAMRDLKLLCFQHLSKTGYQFELACCALTGGGAGWFQNGNVGRFQNGAFAARRMADTALHAG